MVLKELENYQLCLSGYYGAKIASIFQDFSNGNSRTILKYKKILEVDGCTIYITDENMLDFYGFFDTVYQSEYTKKLNNYISNTIYKVEDEELRNKIIEIANMDLSRNSSHHIFNIEILVTCALKKPDYFYFIHTLLKEKYLYTEEKENYEFLIFSIYDAETKEKANSMYEVIMENAYNKYIPYQRNRIYDLKAVASDINGEEIGIIIENNLELIKI